MSRFLHSQCLFFLEIKTKGIVTDFSTTFQKQACFILNSFNCLKATKLLQDIPRIIPVCFIYGIFFCFYYTFTRHRATNVEKALESALEKMKCIRKCSFEIMIQDNLLRIIQYCRHEIA